MKDQNEVIQEFNEIVNMSASELEKWLKSDDSNSAGWPKEDEDGESVGHDSGRKITEILTANPDKDPEKYSEDQIAHMRKVVSYCKRHLAQEEKSNDQKSTEEVKKTKSYASLKNWGHDPLKKRSTGGKSSKADDAKENKDEKEEESKEEEGEEKQAGTKRKQGSNAQAKSNKTRKTRKSEEATNGSNDDEEDDEDGDEELADADDAADGNVGEEDDDYDEDEEEEEDGDEEEDENDENADENEGEQKRKTRSTRQSSNKKSGGKANGANKKSNGAKSSSAKSNGQKKDDDNEDDDGEENNEEKSNGDSKTPKKGPKPGDTVSWNWGSGQPQGKVLDVKGEKTTIQTKRGNEVSRDGDPEDPAVVLDTGKSKAIKSNHELN